MENKGGYVELHLHLDGAITAETAKKLAKIAGVSLPAAEDGHLRRLLTVPENCRSLGDFLKCFSLPLSLLQTYESLSEAAYLVCEDLRRQGILYAELRYAPQLHTERKMSQEDAVKAVLEGIGRSGLKANVILCCMRGKENKDKNLETLLLCSKYLVKDGGVVAMDLAGAEAQDPMRNYRDLFLSASAYHIPFTVHAGEAAGAENVRLAVEYGAKRIGHGVRIFEDENTVGTVIEKGIFLEMCPTSNRQTRAVEDMTGYPLTDYLQKGIRVTLNTDDPAIEGTTIADEFRYMREHFGLTEQQRRILLSNSVDGAFTTERVKRELREKLALEE